ncbi:hypothetical protein BDR07DRAFT_1487709 [Suillus spraguei]|nr:hypothetical protein BDR07DRAFT_1487709 [Suillus spraguei]
MNTTIFPPGFHGEIPAPRRSLLSGDYPRVAGPDQNVWSCQAPKFQVAYSLAPMCFQEEEFMDGVVYENRASKGESPANMLFRQVSALPTSILVAASTSVPAPSASTPLVVQSPQGKYDPKNVIHKAIVEAASELVLKDALNQCCMLTTSTKQATSRAALLDSCGASGRDWALENFSALYKVITAPITELMSSFGNVACGVIQRAHGLHLSVWSEEDKTTHKQALIPDLIDETTLAFIYGKILSLSDNNSQTIQYAFEHISVADVALDAVWTAGYGLYVDSVESLNNIFATSSAAVFC